eukprot:6178938-Pleurochrysis_carterae.AAC.4
MFQVDNACFPRASVPRVPRCCDKQRAGNKCIKYLGRTRASKHPFLSIIKQRSVAARAGTGSGLLKIALFESCAIAGTSALCKHAKVFSMENLVISGVEAGNAAHIWLYTNSCTSCVVPHWHALSPKDSKRFKQHGIDQNTRCKQALTDLFKFQNTKV